MKNMNIKNIKMTNLTLLETMQTVMKFASITGRLGYAISRTLKCMRKEFEPFDEERSKLIRKYGEKDDDGNYSVSPESPDFQEFAEQLASIADEMTSVDFYQISEEEFNEADYFCENCNARDYEFLEALFVAHSEVTNEENDIMDENKAD